MLVLLAGVSGAGKDTIKKMIVGQMENVVTIPSYTTREPRDCDIPGVTYNFVSKEKFKKMIDNDELYEYDFHHDNYYGTSKKLLNDKITNGYTVIKDIDVNGIENLVRILKKDMKVITIFIQAPKDQLIERIKYRTPNISDEEIKLRLSRMEYEESKIPEFDYVVENINIEDAVTEVKNIIIRNL